MDKIGQILSDNGFRFNKQFGQNFITDVNLLNAIVSDSGAKESDTVLEIGTGAGTLTAAIAGRVKRVISYEIDRELLPIISRTLIGLDDKVEVVFKDIMKVADAELDSELGGEYRLIANLPYYITTPVIMRFLERKKKPLSITVMVQKEVAERLTAAPDTENYGAITAAVALSGDARITRIVKKEMFIPSPKVDSAILTIELRDKYPGVDVKRVKRLIKAAFSMRRKTLVNNLLKTGVSRQQAEEALGKAGFDERVRGESLSPDDFIKLAAILYRGNDISE